MGDFPELTEVSKALFFMPINYKAVAFCQTASGAWGEKLLKLLKVETATQLVEAQKDEQLKAMSTQVILTIVGIQ